MPTKTLQWIVFVLLLAVAISGHILVKEMEKTIPEIDYTIYDIPIEKPKTSYPKPGQGPILIEVMSVFQDENKEYKYKFYKKFKLLNYCNCDECQIDWKWGTPPKWRQLTANYSVAANPKSLALGTHLQIDNQKYLVLYVDEKIPENEIYVYVEKHSKRRDGLICDVYKAKP